MAGFGLRLARTQGIEGFSGSTFEFPISATNTTAIFTGDPVVLDGSGNLVRASSTTAAILGVFSGVRYAEANGDFQWRNYWDGAPNRTDIMASVVMPAHGLFWVRGNEGVDFQPGTSRGRAHPFVLAAGNQRYGDSRVTLGAPGPGPVTVHGLVNVGNNAWGTDEPILEVSVNLQTLTFASAS